MAHGLISGHVAVQPDNVWCIGPSVVRVELDSRMREKTGHPVQALKELLPKVIVGGIPTINRVVINSETGRSQVKLLCEG